MASTRAIARALRSYTNIGMTCLEELADFNDVTGNKSGNRIPKTSKKPARKTKAHDQQGKDMPKTDTRESKVKKAVEQKPKESSGSGNKGKTDASGKSDQPKVSEAQKRAIYNLSRRRGVSVQDLETMALDAYDCELENLNSKDASAFIRQLQQAA